MRTLRLESLPSIAPRPAPGARTLARSAFATAFVAHVALGLVILAALPNRPAETFTASMILRFIEPTHDWVCTLPMRPAPPVAPPPDMRGRMTIDYIVEAPTLPQISEIPPAPTLDSANFGDFTLPAEPEAPQAPAPESKPAPRPTAPPTPQPAAPVLATTASPVSTPQPNYPTPAIRQSRAGTAQIRLDVSSEGRVTASELARSSGHPDLDQAALKATARWKFHPARTADGTPMASRVVVPVVFKLR